MPGEYGSFERRLFDIQDSLSEPAFLGVPIGLTLEGFLHRVVTIPRVRQDAVAAVVNWLRYGSRRPIWQLRQTPPWPVDIDQIRNRILFTWLGDKPQLTDLVLPLLDVFPGHECLVLGGESSMASSLPEAVAFLTLDQTPSIDPAAWRTAYQECAPSWGRQIRDLGRRGALRRAALPLLNHHLMIQSQRVMAYGALLDELSPRAIVTEYDRHTRASCLVLAAKTRSIPTLTMFHGVPNGPFGYVPLVADIGLCWGEWYKSKLIDFGTEASRLVVVGRQSIARTISADPNPVKSRLGIAVGRPIAVLATSPVAIKKRRDMARSFCEAIGADGETLGLVRLHPSETAQQYSKVRACYPSVMFTENRQMTHDEAFAIADVVVSHSSSFGSEALVKGKPTIVFNAPLGDHGDDRLLHGEELVDLAGCPSAQSSSELARCIERIVKDDDYRRVLLQKAEQYVAAFCAAYSRDAARNIMRVVRDVTESHVGRDQGSASANFERRSGVNCPRS